MKSSSMKKVLERNVWIALAAAVVLIAAAVLAAVQKRSAAGPEPSGWTSPPSGFKGPVGAPHTVDPAGPPPS